MTREASAKPADGVVVAEVPAKRRLFARLKAFFFWKVIMMANADNVVAFIDVGSNIIRMVVYRVDQVTREFSSCTWLLEL